jgi:DNA-binding PadR family transcriptional regulator
MSRLPGLTEKEELILTMLAQHGKLYALEMVRASEGLLKVGTVYVTLSRMTDKGYITSHKDPAPPTAPGVPRRWYQLSAHGERTLRAWQAAAAHWSEVPA